MSSVTSLRMRVLPRFPARISGTNGLTVDVESPDLILKPDFGALAEIVTVETPADTYFWVWRAGIDEYDRISFQKLVDGIGSIIIGPNLIGIASISSAADKVPYFLDNLGNASSFTMTSFVRGISGSATAGAYRTALGLGGAATLNVGTTAGTVAAGDDSRLVNAVQTSRTLTAGTGIAAIGDLSANRTIALNPASIASLGLADTSLQPGAADSNTNFLQAGTGAAARTSRNKSRDVINVLDFGAVGNGTTDDSAAIQKAVDLLRSLGSNNRPGLVFGHEGGAKHNFCISNPINLTGFNDAVGMTVDLNGSIIVAKTNGKPVFDMLDSQRIEICNGGMYGDPSAPPSYGVQMGRALGTVPDPLLNGRVENVMRKVRFTGAYSGACMINSASEICLFDKCGFWNSSQAAGSACVILDSRRAVNLLSDFFTVTQPNNVASSFNDTVFLNCTFEKIGGENPALGNAIKIYGGAFRAMKMISCYAQNEYGAAVYVSGDITACEFDLHCEATNLANNFLIDTSLGNTLWRECKIMEYGMFCTDALIKGSGGSGNVFWSSSEVSVPVAYTNKKLFNKNGATFRFHGEINIGDAVSAGTYDLSVLNALNGEVKCSLAASNVVVPAVGAFKITDFNSIEQRYTGLQHFMGSLALEPSGTNLVVASGVLTIPRNQGTSFYIASGGNITSIAIDPVNDKGRIVCLVFGYTGTMTNSLANKIFLASNYSFVANNTLWLISDGSKWAEICRCANVVA